MKNIFFLLFFSALAANAQIINTVAGNGIGTYAGDNGPATAASLGSVGYLVFDRDNNYYIGGLNNTIRRVSTTGVITTVAGNGTTGGGGDGGPATAAQFDFTAGGGMAFDADNNLYVGDGDNNRIRKINVVTGLISTFAGTGVAGFAGDGGHANVALLHAPGAIAFDSSGNLFFVDGFNFRIRKIDKSGIITTIAGVGTMGFSGDGGPATAAKIQAGGGMRIGNRNELFHADGIRIRKIDLTTGIITTVAGTGVFGFSGDSGPATAAQFYNTRDVAIDIADNIYICDYSNHRIRRVNSSGIINTWVGNGTGAYSGDGGLATAAEINSPRSVALDQCGNLYIATNGDSRVRKVTFNPDPCPTLGVDDMAEQKISVYPNPAGDVLHVDNVGVSAMYKLVNVVGAAVREGVLRQGNNSVDIAHLAAGVYVLDVVDSEGKRSVSKVVKQ